MDFIDLQDGSGYRVPFINKWASNSYSLGIQLKDWLNEEGVSVTLEEEFKFLGFKWCQSSDRIGVFVEKSVTGGKGEKPTKRLILKTLATIFDPLGLVSPLTIRLKIWLQELWKIKVDWDKVLEQEAVIRLQQIITELRSSGNIMVDRPLKAENCQPIKRELHAFSDASMAAYGAVIFLRELFEKRAPRVSWVLAKARVAPLKGKWTIHRLELLGAIIAVRLMHITKNILVSLLMKHSSIVTIWQLWVG